MRTDRNRKRALRRRVTIACLAAALALPAAAGARIQADSDFGSHATPASAPPQPVEVVRAPGGDGSQTLAIILSSAALGIALGGAGYAVARLRPMLRTPVGRSS